MAALAGGVSGCGATGPLRPRTLGGRQFASSVGCCEGSEGGAMGVEITGSIASGTVMVTLGSSAGACEHPNTVQPPFSA